MLLCLSLGPEKLCTVLCSIQVLVGHAGLPVPDNILDVSHLAECGLHDCVTLMELSRVLPHEQSEVQSRIAEAGRLEEPVCAVEEDQDALCVAPARADYLTTEGALLKHRVNSLMQSATFDWSFLQA